MSMSDQLIERARAWLESSADVPYGTPERETELDAAHHNAAYDLLTEFTDALRLAQERIATLERDWREQDDILQRLLTVSEADDEHVTDAAKAGEAIEAAIRTLRQRLADGEQK